MARKFDFEVITLNRKAGGEYEFEWRCKHRCKSRAPVSYSDLGCLLDEFGAQGWSVVAATSDGRFGNQVVLQREVVEESASEPTVLTAAATPPAPAPDGMSAALVNEVKALRQAMEERWLPHQPLVPPSPAPTFDPATFQEGVRAALLPFLHELQSISERARQEGIQGSNTLNAQAVALSEVGAALTRFAEVMEERDQPQPKREWARVFTTWLTRLSGWSRPAPLSPERELATS